MLVYGSCGRAEKKLQHSYVLTKEKANYSVFVFVTHLSVFKGKVDWVKSQYMDFE